MSRFFFNIRDGRNLMEDPDGGLFINIEAARVEAIAAARELLSALLVAGEPLDGQRIEIMDEGGLLRGTVWFRDVVRLA